MISGYIIIPVLAAGMSGIILDLIKKQKDGNEAFMSLNIGKVGIPDSILNKPDKLSDIEFEKIKEHPLLGLDSIRNGDYLWMKALNMKSFFRYNWLGIFILFLAVSALFINSPLYAHGNKKHSDTSQTEVMKAPTSM